VGGGWSDGMRVVIHKNGMLEMSIINVIFLTNVEKCVIFLVTQLLIGYVNSCQLYTLCLTLDCIN